MPVIVVANPKGGVGKSTVSTQLAGYLAHRGHRVMLGDADRQQSSRAWLGLRPEAVPPIATWEVDRDHIVKPPKGTTHIVLDTPAGLHGKRLDEGVAREAARLASEAAQPGSDLRGTADYKKQIIRTLTYRALRTAAQRAMAGGTQ